MAHLPSIAGVDIGRFIITFEFPLNSTCGSLNKSFTKEPLFLAVFN